MPLPNLTNEFAADTYGGILHTSNVPFLGTTIPPIYDGLGNKSSLSLGSDGNGASISGTLSADGLAIRGYATIVDYIYPIGSVYLDTLNANPQIRFVGTTWSKISEGKFLAGVGSGVDKNLTSGTIAAGDNTTIGEYNHTLSTSELPSHTHKPKLRFVSTSDDNAGASGYLGSSPRALADADKYLDDLLPPALINDNTGGGASHNNLPPYFGVYVWKRTS